jgi:hypothetical protein
VVPVVTVVDAARLPPEEQAASSAMAIKAVRRTGRE